MINSSSHHTMSMQEIIPDKEEEASAAALPAADSSSTSSSSSTSACVAVASDASEDSSNGTSGDEFTAYSHEEDHEKDDDNGDDNITMRIRPENIPCSSSSSSVSQESIQSAVVQPAATATASSSMSTLLFPFFLGGPSCYWTCSNKASPLSLKSWIVLALTLDGRDKITKLIQYTCRWIAHYYDVCAASLSSSSLSSSTSSRSMAEEKFIMDAIQQLQSQSKRFRNLQNALTSSRKAYRLGRSLIELEKLQSIGLGRWILWKFRHVWMRNVHETRQHNDKKHHDDTTSNQNVYRRNKNILRWNPNMPGPTTNNDNDGDETRVREQGVATSKISSAVGHKREQDASSSSPPRMHLPRKISSNMGGPTAMISSSLRMGHDGSTQESVVVEGNAPRLGRRLSNYIGNLLYVSLLSSNYPIDQVGSMDMNQQEMMMKMRRNMMTTKEPPPSLWNVCLSAAKLLNLTGFWAADNISYLYSCGFWVEDKQHPNKRRNRARDASIVAARCYFFAALSGLCLNLKEFINYQRNGSLKETFESISRLKQKLKDMDSEDHDGAGEDNVAFRKHEYEMELGRLEEKFKGLREKYTTICMALLKSICDVLVFSNNTGVDLHLKYRGKKMNESLHCACGVTSALTVLYNNFPCRKS